MNFKHLFVAVPAAFLVLSNGVASAGETITMQALSPASMTSGMRRKLRRATSWSTTPADAFTSPTLRPRRRFVFLEGL